MKTLRAGWFFSAFTLLLLTVAGCDSDVSVRDNPFDPGSSSPAPATVRGAVNAPGRPALAGRASNENIPVRIFLEKEAPATGSDGGAAPSSERTASTNAEGIFLLSEVVPGIYRLEIREPGFATVTLRSVAVPLAENIDLGTIELVPTVETSPSLVNGQVLLEGLDPASTVHGGISVRTVGWPFDVLTAPDGTFQLPISDGTFDFEISFPNYETFTLAGVIIGVGETVTLDGDENTPDADPVILLSNPGSITGTIERELCSATPPATYEPGDGVAVSAGLDANPLYSAVADPTGAFVIGGMTAGIYRVDLSLTGWEPVRLTGNQVAAGQITDLGSIQLTASRGAITGRMELSGSADHSGILVQVNGTNFVTLTGADGSYRIEGVCAGTGYEVVASRDGYVTTSISGLAVVAGQDTTVTDAAGNDPVLERQQGGLTLNGGYPYVNTNDVGFQLDAPAGTTHMRLSEDPSVFAGQGDPANPDPATNGGWVAYTVTGTFTLGAAEGTHDVIAQVYGNGAFSGLIQGTVVLDQTAPLQPTIIVEDDSGFSNDQDGGVLTTLTASEAAAPGVDVTSGLASLKFVNLDPAVCATPPCPPVQTDWDAATTLPYNRTIDHPVLDPLVDGPKEIWVVFSDRAGNWSAPVATNFILDRQAPTGTTISINNGDAFARSDRVSVTLAVTNAGTPAEAGLQMRLANDTAFLGSQWQPFTPILTWFLDGQSDGQKEVWVQFMDAAGNITQALNDDITLDRALPIALSFDIVDLASTPITYTNDATLHLRPSSADSTQMAVSISPSFLDPTGTAVPWVGYVSSYDWTLPPNPPALNAAEGRYEVYVQFRDDADNRSATLSSEIVLDQTDPTVAGAILADGVADPTTGWTHVTATNVTLLTTAIPGPLDGHEMQLEVASLDATGAQTSLRIALPWGTYSPSQVLALDTTEGHQQVIVTLRDAAGNLSLPVPVDVVLDGSAPVVTGVVLTSQAARIDGGSGLVTHTGITQVSLNITVTLPADAAQMRVANRADFAGAIWQPFAATIDWTLPPVDQLHTVFIEIRDIAGNIGPGQVSVTLDRAAPTGVSVIVDGGNTYSQDLTVDLILAANDGSSGMASVEVSNDPGFTVSTLAPWPMTGGVPDASHAITAWTLEPVDGLATIYARFTDAVGNVINAAGTIIIDREAPVGSVSIDSDVAYAIGTAVVLTFTAPADTADVLVSNTAIPSCDAAVGYTGFVGSQAWTLTAGDATKTVYACLRDAAGNTTLVQDDIILDTTDPDGGTLSLDAGAIYATATPVTLSITADADVTLMAVGNGTLDCATASYEPFAGVRSWVLSAGDATKTVVVCFQDAAGRIGSASDTIVLDTTVPAGTIVLDGGAAVTDASSVAVALTYAVDTSGYALANGALDCGVATYTATTGSSLSTTWGLPPGDGVKTVVVCFEDPAGNSASYATTITLDQTSPVGTLIIDSGAIYSDALGVQLGLTAPGDTAQMTFSNTAIASCDSTTGWQPYAPSRAWNLALGDGPKTVYGCLRDVAGNTSAVQDGIVLDTTTPDNGVVSIDAGATYATSTPVTLSITADSDVTSMAVGNSTLDCTTAIYEPYAGVRSWVLSVGDATKTVVVCFQDAAGLIGSASDTIILDTTVPTGTIVLDSGAAVTDTLTVAVALTYASDTAGYALANGALDCGVASYSATTGTGLSTTWGLPVGDGVKTLVVCFEDNAGNSASYATTITLDQTAPAGAVSIDAGSIYTNGIDVQLGLTAPGDTARMTFSNAPIASCGSATGWQPFAPSRAWNLTTGDGTKTVYGCLEDTAGNTASVFDEIELDTSAPAGTIALQGDTSGYTLAGSGAGFTFSTAVQALLTAPTDTVEVSLADGPTLDCNTATYQAYAGIIPHTLPAGDGDKIVSVCFRDAAGNSAGTSGTVTLDTAPPTVGLLLASGATYTTLASVTVNLSFLDDTDGYALAESTLDCAGATYTAVTVGNTSASDSFALSAGDGTKTVVVCVREAAGRVASTSGTIVLDTTIPTGTISINDGTTYATSTTASLRFVAPADTTRMSVANAAVLDCTTASYVGFASPITWSLAAGSGLKSVTVCFEDAAGNQDSATDTITLDLLNPTGTMTIDAGATHTQNTSVVLDFTATADVTGLAVAEAATLDCATVTYQPYTPSMAFTLSGTAGGKNLIACFEDAAGLTGTTSASIILDASSPTGSITLAGGAATTTSTSVSVGLTFPDDTTGYAIGDGVIDCAAATYTSVSVGTTSAGTTHTLPSSDGTKTVSACFTDAATNTAWSADTIILDTSPPSGTVSIDLGAEFNITGTSSLTFSAPSDTTEMAVINGATIDCAAASYVAFSSPLAWPLPAPDGTKTVSVCFRDAAGLSASAQDSIIRDLADPVGSLTIQGDTSGYTLVGSSAGYTFSASVSLALSAPADTTELAVGDGATINCGAVTYQPFAGLVAHALPGADGTKTVSVCFKDAAGRVSDTSDSIILDTVPPTGSALLDSGNTYSADTSVGVGLTFLADTNGYALAENSIDCVSATYTSVTVGLTSASTSFSISAGDGVKTVVACIREAGGRAVQAQDTILLDGSDPIGTVSIDSGSVYDTDGSVTLFFFAPADTAELAVVDGATIDCAAATYQSFAASLPWSLPGLDGTKTVSVCYRDGAGNTASTFDEIILDTSSPSGGTVSIASGAAFATGTVVSLDLSAPADVIEVAVANAASLDCATASYGPYTTPRTWVLGAGDGTKTVTACFRDAAGRTGSASDTITLDTLAPSGTIDLAAGQDYATTTPLAVALGFPNDTAGYALAEGSLDCPTATYTPVIVGNTSASTNFGPSFGDGVKTVVACFEDTAGNHGSAVDTVNLDSSPPVGTVAIDAGAIYATSTGVTLNLTAPSDTTQMAVLEAAIIDCSSGLLVWEGFATTKGITLGGQGTRTVSVCFRDAAGLTASASDTIIVDSVDPTGSVAINNGDSHTRTPSVSLNITADADVVAISVADGGTILCGSVSYEPFSASRAWTLPAGAGSKTVSVCLLDAAGNFASVSDAITLDPTPPSTATLLIDGGVAYSTSTTAEVTLTLTTPETVTVAIGNESIDCASATYGAFAGTVNGWSIQDQDGVRTVVACLKDAAGWIVSKSDSIILDRAPPAGTVNIDAGATYALSTGVTLNLTAPSDTTQMAVEESSTIDCASGLLIWEAFSTTKGITLGGQNTRTVSVCFRDAAGLTASDSDSIIVDSVNPTGSVAINNGATHTQVTSVSLDITADGDVVAISVADGGTILCGSVTYEPFSASRAWTLPAGAGSKTVSVCLKDAAGNFAPVSDSIIYDPTPPSTATLEIDGGADYVTNAAGQVTLTLTTPETVTVAIGNESIDCNSATFGAFAGTVNNWNLQNQDGVRTVVACFKDAAGWIVSKSDDIILDRQAPTVALTIDAGATHTTDDLVDLAFTASSDVTSMAVIVPPLFCSGATYIPFAPSVASYDLDLADLVPANDGFKFVRVCVEDASGQRGEDWAFIVLDRVNPSGTMVLAGGATHTNDRTITVELNGVSTDTVEMAVAETSLACGSATYGAFSANFPFTLSDSDVLHTVIVCLKDSAGRTAQASDTITLDRGAPGGTLSLDSGATWSTDLDVVATVTSGDAVEYAIAAETIDCTAAAYNALSSPATPLITLVDMDGTRSVVACLRDEAGNVATVSDTINLDTTPPTFQTISYDSYYSQDDSVDFTLAATDNLALTQMRLSRNWDGSDGVWEAFSTLKTWDANGTDPDASSYEVTYFWVRDAAGNVSIRWGKSNRLDFDDPWITNFTLRDPGLLDVTNGIVNNTLVYARTTRNDVYHSATWINEIRVGESPTLAGVPWSYWYTNTAYTLSSNNGTKTVYVQIRDDSGRESVIVSQQITLDTQAPSVLSVVSTDPVPPTYYTNSTSVTVDITASDNLAVGGDLTAAVIVNYSWPGPDCSSQTYAFPFPGSCTSSPCVLDHTASIPATLGWRYIWACVEDAAGNRSATAQRAYVYYDNIAPSQVTGLYLSPGSRQMTVSWATATDANAGVDYYQVQYSTSSTFSGATTVQASTPTALIEGLDNWIPYYVRVRAVDKAGNPGPWSTDASTVLGIGVSAVSPVEPDRAGNRPTLFYDDGVLWVFTKWTNLPTSDDRHEFRVGRCEAATLDCKKPANWTWFDEYIIDRLITTEKPSVVTTSGAILVASTQEDISSGVVGNYLMYCNTALNACDSINDWAYSTFSTPSGTNVNGSLSMVQTTTHVVAAHLVDDTTDVLRIRSCELGTNDCSSASAHWSATTVDITNPAPGIASSAPAMVADERYVWIIHPEMTVSGGFPSFTYSGKLRVTRCDTRSSSATHACGAYTTNDIVSEARFYLDMDATIVDGYIYLTYKKQRGGKFPSSDQEMRRCALSTGCTLGSHWSTVNNWYSGSYVTGGGTTGTYDLEATPGELHLTLWNPDTQSIEYQVCDNPGATACTIPGNWRSFPIQNYQTAYSAPSLEIYGSNIGLAWLTPDDRITVALPRVPSPHEDASIGGGLEQLQANWTPNLEVAGNAVVYTPGSSTNWQSQISVTDPYQSRTSVPLPAGSDYTAALRSYSSNGEPSDDSRPFRFRPLSDQGPDQVLPDSTEYVTRWSSSGRIVQAYTEDTSGTDDVVVEWCNPSSSDCAITTNWKRTVALNPSSNIVRFDMETDGTYVFVVGSDFGNAWVSRCAWSTGCDLASEWSTFQFGTNHTYPRITMNNGRLWVLYMNLNAVGGQTALDLSLGYCSYATCLSTWGNVAVTTGISSVVYGFDIEGGGSRTAMVWQDGADIYYRYTQTGSLFTTALIATAPTAPVRHSLQIVVDNDANNLYRSAVTAVWEDELHFLTCPFEPYQCDDGDHRWSMISLGRGSSTEYENSSEIIMGPDDSYFVFNTARDQIKLYRCDDDCFHPSNWRSQAIHDSVGLIEPSENYSNAAVDPVTGKFYIGNAVPSGSSNIILRVLSDGLYEPK